MQDIAAIQSSGEEGAISEQIFTQQAVDLLAASGESENIVVRYDEKGLGTQKQHKINAYAISENYETVDLFVTIFNGTEEISKVSGQEIDTATKRISNFFRKAIYAADDEKNKYFRSEYVDEIEETSEIFQFAYTLAKSQDIKENLVRVNAFILTNGSYKGEFPSSTIIAGYNFYYKVFDIESLYNISGKSHIPIEINFKKDGFNVPCIPSPSVNEEYQSYLAIISGEALASIYERFGSRLLEQNVRSFLQFNGKINKGIRTTIMKEPEMFLAFNNGIAATADEIELVDSEDGKGKIISVVKDLQIVNGGQTTASIYHTQKKDKANISNIFVQVKLSVVKNKEKFGEIVSRISEYANTQNKVSVVDLSSNKPSHIELEKVSRSVWAPAEQGEAQQTSWFYERARGQYKNAILKFGLSPSKRRAFELKNPKQQVFTKEDLAKYVNSWQEVYDGKKLVIGPHFVVRGNQKNYVQFMNFNFEKKPDNIFFEDTIAKAILFKAAEKTYGVKPNAIGDMRYITVPYSIAWLGFRLKYKLDLYKIWKNQSVSDKLKELIYEIMNEIEKFIKKNAPGSLYGEYAKKEDCWNAVKENSFNIDLSVLKADLESSLSATKRQRISDDEIEKTNYLLDIERIKSIPSAIWIEIEKWAYINKTLTSYLLGRINTIQSKIRTNKLLDRIDIAAGDNIIEIVMNENPLLLHKIDNYIESLPKNSSTFITIELINEMLYWDKHKKKLKDSHFRFMLNIASGKIELTERNKKLVLLSLNRLRLFGFRPSNEIIK